MTSLTDPPNGRPRVELVDALRGFAIVGVILANVLAQSGFNPFLHPEHIAAPVDRLTFDAVANLVDGRFMALFSMLFGIGFGMQVRRATEHGVSLFPLYTRRLVGLLVIGLLHHVFLSAGDILVDYVVLGLILILFRTASTRTLMLAAGLCLFLPLAARLAIEGLQIQRPPPVDPAVLERIIDERLYLERITYNWASLGREWWAFTRFNSAYLAVFLAGLLVARTGVLAAPRQYLPEIRWTFLACALVTIALFAINAPLQTALSQLPAAWSGGLSTVAGTARAFAQALGYGAAFILLWEVGGRFTATLQGFRHLGRMALTNYLSISLFGTVVFFWGGLRGTIRPSIAVCLGLALSVLLHLGSRWWLTRYHMGPVEWVWRAFTYGRVPVWRISHPSTPGFSA